MFFFEGCSCNSKIMPTEEIIIVDDNDDEIIENDCYVEIITLNSKQNENNKLGNIFMSNTFQMQSFLQSNIKKVLSYQSNINQKVCPSLLYQSQFSSANSSCEVGPKRIKTVSDYLKNNIF